MTYYISDKNQQRWVAWVSKSSSTFRKFGFKSGHEKLELWKCSTGYQLPLFWSAIFQWNATKAE